MSFEMHLLFFNIVSNFPLDKQNEMFNIFNLFLVFNNLLTAFYNLKKYSLKIKSSKI